MCLKIVFNKKQVSELNRGFRQGNIAYKVVIRRGRKIFPMFRRVGKKEFSIHTRLNEKDYRNPHDKGLRNINGTNSRYPYGFHAYATLADAVEESKVRRESYDDLEVWEVRLTDVVAIGVQDWCVVFVAKKIEFIAKWAK